MKTLLLTMTLAGTLAFAQDGTQTRLPPSARDQQKPRTGNPQEGTETRLSQKKRDDLQEWAYNSLGALQELRRETKNLPRPLAKERLMAGFKRISLAAEPFENELLMRYTLNKAMAIVTELEKGMQKTASFVDDAAVRVLTGFINIAEEFYDSDIKFAQKIANGGDYEPEHVRYSITVATLFNTYVESIADIASQYNLYYKMLGFFANDMARSKRSSVVGPIAVPIDDFLDTIPSSVEFDRDLAERGRSFLPLSFWVQLPTWHKDLYEMRNKFSHYYGLAVKAHDKNKPI